MQGSIYEFVVLCARFPPPRNSFDNRFHRISPSRESGVLRAIQPIDNRSSIDTFRLLVHLRLPFLTEVFTPLFFSVWYIFWKMQFRMLMINENACVKFWCALPTSIQGTYSTTARMITVLWGWQRLRNLCIAPLICLLSMCTAIR